MYVQIDEEHWMKAGLGFADGHLGLGAVVTDFRSIGRSAKSMSGKAQRSPYV